MVAGIGPGLRGWRRGFSDREGLAAGGLAGSALLAALASGWIGKRCAVA